MFKKLVRLIVICLLITHVINHVNNLQCSGVTKKALLKTDLVEIQKINPSIKIDVRYATKNNFTGKVLYNSARAFARRGTAEKLDAIQKELAEKKLGLKVWDCYRPRSVQYKMWEIFPLPDLVADPKKGSKHNRGSAVDLTLVSLVDGKELEMPTPFDELTERAGSDYATGISKRAIANRTLLKTVMVKNGFTSLKSEWWHFDDNDWESYELMDVPFEELEC